MGGGSWSSSLYCSSSADRKARKVKDFEYDDTMKSSTPYDSWKPHTDLDPKEIVKSVNGVRESRDSAEHPETVGIVVFFDVTGSMHIVPQIFQKALSKLMSFVIMKSGIEHPHILVGAIGDATCDKVPLQVSQFESDNRVDEHLRKIVLEGGGGGQQTESYELAIYTAAKLLSMDCYEKRGKKGYLFISGDEMPYSKVKRNELKNVLGIPSEVDIPLEELFEEAKEKFNVYFIFPKGASYWNDAQIPDTWKKYVGQNFLRLDNPEAICELIAMTIAQNEGIDIEDISKDLIDLGATKDSVSAATKALATVSSDAKESRKAVAKVTGDVSKVKKATVKRL